jgi:hypothetical protein
MDTPTCWFPRDRMRLPCGCEMQISSGPRAATVHRRTIYRRSQGCVSPAHQPGARVYVWELLPPPGGQRRWH